MAKRYYNLYQRLVSFENLRLAYRKAAKGKRGHPGVADFEFNLEGNLFNLQAELQSQIYQPGPYNSFYICDPKHRLISAAPFRDRVVHHALCNIIEPIFERTFIGDSYANRIGKGTHAALDCAQRFTRCFSYVLQCDIQQFFPSLDHNILFDIISRKIGDSDVLDLCWKILLGGRGILQAEYEMVYYPADDLLAALRPRALPIGNLTSQFWANVYLNELDQFVKRELRVVGYLRYVDDFLLFANEKRLLWEWKKAVHGCLADLRLAMHEGSSTVYPVDNGVPFLGFRVYPSFRRIKRRNGLAFQRRFKKLMAEYSKARITKIQLDRSVQGWVAHACHANTYGLRRSIFRAYIPKFPPLTRR